MWTEKQHAGPLRHLSLSVSVAVPHALVCVPARVRVRVGVCVWVVVRVGVSVCVGVCMCGYVDVRWPFSFVCLLVCLFVGLLVSRFACLSLCMFNQFFVLLSSLFCYGKSGFFRILIVTD